MKVEQETHTRLLWFWLIFLLVILAVITYFGYWFITNIFYLTSQSKTNFITTFGEEKGQQLWQSFSEIVKNLIYLVFPMFFMIGLFFNVLFSEAYKTIKKLYKNDKIQII